jgi:hypothetical protein
MLDANRNRRNKRDGAKCLGECTSQLLKNHELAALREGPLKEKVAAE